MGVKKFTAVIAGILAAASLAVADPGRLRLVCDDWPPYQIVEKEGILGFSTEVVRAVLARMGDTGADVEAYPWKRALVMVERGMADGIFSANDTPERREFAYYPGEPLVISPWVIWVRQKDRLRIHSLDDLKELTVGVVGGYSYTPEFWHFLRTRGRYEEVVDDLHNFKKLSAGRVDAIVAELGNGRYLVDRLKIRGVEPLETCLVKVDGLYLIFSKRSVSESFVRKFSETLGALKKSAVYERLFLRYFKDGGGANAPGSGCTEAP